MTAILFCSLVLRFPRSVAWFAAQLRARVSVLRKRQAFAARPFTVTCHKANGAVLPCVAMIKPVLIDLKRFREEESAFGFNDFFRVVLAWHHPIASLGHLAFRGNVVFLGLLAKASLQ